MNLEKRKREIGPQRRRSRKAMKKNFWMILLVLLFTHFSLITTSMEELTTTAAHTTRNELSTLTKQILNNHLVKYLSIQDTFKVGIVDKSLFTKMMERVSVEVEENKYRITKICNVIIPENLFVHMKYLKFQLNISHLKGLCIMPQIKSTGIFMFVIYTDEKKIEKMLNWKNTETNAATNLLSISPMSPVAAGTKFVTWGYADRGGNSVAVQDRLNDIKMIYSTHSAFAALKKDGSVVTWGDPRDGGNSDGVQNRLNDIKMIYSTGGAFSALKNDGSVVTWGDE